MIREGGTLADTTVWWEICERRKISWRMDEYMAILKSSRDEAEMRRTLYGLGATSELTEQDIRELKCNPPVMAAKALAAGGL